MKKETTSSAVAPAEQQATQREDEEMMANAEDLPGDSKIALHYFSVEDTLKMMLQDPKVHFLLSLFFYFIFIFLSFFFFFLSCNSSYPPALSSLIRRILSRISWIPPS